MAAIFHPRLRTICKIHKARKLSLYTRPYVTLSLFITTISICCLICPDFKYLTAGAENVSSLIHIGALVSYDTFNGRVARKAIQMAVDSINKDKNILNNSELVLHMLDTNCSAFLGVAAGKLSISLQFFDWYIVSVTAHAKLMHLGTPIASIHSVLGMLLEKGYMIYIWNFCLSL